MNCIGTYDGTIFYNPANKFCIVSVKTADQSVPAEARSNRRYKDHLIRFTAVGYEIPRTDAVELELDGEWTKGKYGVQLQVEQWREIVPRTKNGVEGYLASGLKPRDVQFIADRMSMVQVYNYVRRQMPSFRRNSHEVLRTWEDYLSMAKKLHMDVYDEIVYRTRKLRRRHDDLVLKCQEKDIELQAEEMEEKFPHVNAICQEIKTKYEYADADYMVVVPSGILDIITEGRALHHCVGSSDRYWDRIERRESFVMFLRKTDDPFHAYYTLEVEPDGTVRQKRTEYDRQKKDIEQATEFLQKWQRVVTARLTESDKALAAESRVLREKEFIQLKKDRVIIHTGHLAGKLLVDVLMADLMENTDSIQSPALAAAA